MRFFTDRKDKSIVTTPPALAVNTYPADAKSFELQGRSLVLNQLVVNGDFSDNSYWSANSGSFTVANNIATFMASASTGMLYHSDIAIQANHKYVVLVNVKLTTATTSIRLQLRDTTNNVTLGDASSIAITDWQRLSFIVTTTAAVNVRPRIVDFRASDWDVVQIKEVMLIDLTQMFNAGFEPTTVDQLQSIIDLSKYIPFNPGTFIHNNATYEVNKWNQEVGQLTPSSINNLTVTFVNGVLTITGTASANTNLKLVDNDGEQFTNGHKYLIVGVPTGGSSTTYGAYWSNVGMFYSDTIYTYSNSGTFNIRILNGTTVNISCIPQVIDLTDIFGAGKEPSTVDECKLRFLVMGIDITKYQPYSPLGSNLGGKVDLGFNVWDGTGTDGVGMSTQSGGTYASSSNFVTDYIGVIAGEKYYLNSTNWESWVCYYNANKTYLSYVTSNNQGIVTMPSTAVYVRLTGKLSTKSTACFNLSQPDTTKSPHNGDYRPYLMLRGIGSNFNIFNEVWTVNTALNDYGETFTISNYSTTDWIAVIPNTKYYITTPATDSQASNCLLARYDKNKTFVSAIRHQVTSNWSNREIIIPDGVYYIRFYIGTAYTRVCVNLSQPQTIINPHNGQYVPHLFDTYDSMSGILTRRIGTIDLGTLNFVYDSTYAYWEVAITGFALPPNIDTKGNISHPIYENRVTAGFSATGNNGITLVMTGYLRVKTTSSSVRPSGMLLYELTTPTIETTITQPISFVAGKLGKQYGVIDLGSLAWTYADTTKVFMTAYSSVKPVSNANVDVGNIICSAYTPKPYGYIANHLSEDMMIGLNDNATNVIRIRNLSYSDTTSFKNSLQGQYLIYELADGATGMTYATAGNLIQKTDGDVGDVDFNLKYVDDTLYLVTGNGQLLSVED